jgi:protein gp37
MYYLDKKRGIDTSVIYRTASFDLPVRRDRNGRYKLPPGMRLYVGLSTDFFLEEADAWRDEVWRMMRQRSDILFKLLTKRARRMAECLPDDWGEGYPNVELGVTVEDQRAADERMPILVSIPARHKAVTCAPLIGSVDIEQYLASGEIERVAVGGENYDGARPCHYEWVESLSEQCRRQQTTFVFFETGTVFVKAGRSYRIPSKQVQSEQAHRSGLSHTGRPVCYELVNPEPTLFEMAPWEPHFRKRCATCGSRPLCNGCSECGACDRDDDPTSPPDEA